ncbi:MAG: hypothetical protein KatS3mg077_0531 [Candidatus Binatia bacterium]|nr:MAG: hypothetical protein KatS3mg077_0531 [Candidatus Binatia bacterium]
MTFRWRSSGVRAGAFRSGKGLALLCLIALLFRFPFLNLPFDIRELELVSVPWLGQPEGSDGVRRLLGHIADTAWYWSLDEGLTRLPWLLVGVIAVVLIAWGVGKSLGALAGYGAGLVLAVSQSDALSGTFLGAGPWVLTASLGAVVAVQHYRERAPLIALVLASVAILPLARLGPAIWMPWVSSVFLLAPRATQGGPARKVGFVVVCASAALLLAWVQAPVPRSYWLPWDKAAVFTLRGEWSEWCAPGMWVLALAGLWRIARSRAGGWLLVWLAAAVLCSALAQSRRWILDDGLVAVIILPFLAAAGVGASLLVELCSRRRLSLAGKIVAMALLLGLATLGRPPKHRPDWPAIAQLVAGNAGARDVFSSALCLRALVFYAPELFFRFPREADLARALVVFPAAESGWFVAPGYARLHPAWSRVEQWVEQFGVVDLSPDPSVHVFYFRRAGRGAALRRIADFTLPAATLSRGRLLADLVEASGPLPSALWKVDQLVLEPPAASMDRNGGLLEAAKALARFRQLDRANSLLDRLLSMHPDWVAAARVKEALCAEVSSGPGGFD